MTGEVRAVTFEGSVAVLYLIAEAGDELAVACEPRMAHDIESALALGSRPLVEYEPWAVLWPTGETQVRVVAR